MGTIPEETIEAVSAATDVVELISSYIPVKRAGSQFKALCPFHNERSPSFSISPQRQAFHCFGCGESGDAIAFVMKYENLAFVDAVKKLADAAGVPIIEQGYDANEEKIRRGRSRLIEMHNKATDYMHQLLMKSPSAQHGRDYLKSRGFGSEMAARWKIGWMPDDYTTFLSWAKEQGFKGRELVNGSLAGLRDTDNPAKGIYPKFKNRLMFPIHNDYGDVIAFSGRQLVEDKRSGKYVNSNETAIFKKSKIFFGLDKARRHMSKLNFALLCEGQIDVISCVEAGIENAVAGLGTALTADHARILKRYTSHATLCFDADPAGYKAAESAFKELTKLVESALDFFDFKFEIAKEQINLNDIQAKTSFANDLATLVSLIPNKQSREAYIQQISTRLNLGASTFQDTVFQSEKRKQFEKSATPSYSSEPDFAELDNTPTSTPLDTIIGELCIYALYDSASMNYLGEELENISEPVSHSQGGQLLLEILAKRPKCDTPAALNTFMLQLRESDRMAVSQLLANPLPEDIFSTTQQTVSMLLNEHLQRRESAIRSALQRTDLTPNETAQLLQETQEIAKLLNGLPDRYIR